MGTYLCRQVEQRDKISSHHTTEAQILFKSVNLNINKLGLSTNSRGRQYFPCQYLGKGSYGTSVEVFLKQKKDQHLVQKITRTDWLKQNFLFLQTSLFKQLNNSLSFVKVLYISLHGKKMYIISEKQRYGNLYTFMRRYPKYVQYHMIKQLCIRVIMILDKLHSKNIIYRSIRPENVIFVDQFGEIKLTELVFSKVCTNATAFVGPATYTPPEVYKDNSTGYSQNADFWMLGVMLYQLVVGHTPFQAANLAAIKDNVLNFNPESLKFPQQTPICEDLTDFIVNLLQPNPESRMSFNDIKRHKFFNGECWDEDRDQKALVQIRQMTDKQESIAPNRIVFSNSTKKSNLFPQQFLQINFDQRSIYHSV